MVEEWKGYFWMEGLKRRFVSGMICGLGALAVGEGVSVPIRISHFMSWVRRGRHGAARHGLRTIHTRSGLASWASWASPKRSPCLPPAATLMVKWCPRIRSAQTGCSWQEAIASTLRAPNHSSPPPSMESLAFETMRQ